MVKDDWLEMITRFRPELYYSDGLGSYTNANEKRGCELNDLRVRCSRMERDLIVEREKNKKLQE